MICGVTDNKELISNFAKNNKTDNDKVSKDNTGKNFYYQGLNKEFACFSRSCLEDLSLTHELFYGYTLAQH